MVATAIRPDIGDLRNRVTIQQQVRSADGRGGYAITYAVRAVVMAAVTTVSSKEALQAGTQTSGLLSAVTIRYRSDISVNDRILWGTRTLQVQSFQDQNGDRRFLRLVCVETQGTPVTPTLPLNSSWVQENWIG